MAFVDLPVFVPRQILTAALLNQIIASLEGFSTQTADISWPLVAGGNLDMDSTYTIDNMRTLWKVVNADEYDDPKLENALAAVASGGCVFIPPNTTIDGTTGVTIAGSNVWIVGCGTSSIIDLTSGAGPLCDTDASLSNVGFMNLQLRESSATASADGIVFRRTTGPTLINILFTGFDGDSVYYTNDGTQGNPCADAVMRGVIFDGGGANGNHIKADDLDGFFASHVLSKSAGAGAVLMDPAGVNSIIRDIQLDSTVRIEGTTGKGISILGKSATADDKWSRVSLTGVKVISPTNTAIEVGVADQIVRSVDIVGCIASDVSGAGFHVNAQQGQVESCRATSAGTGIDVEDSEDLDVQGNSFRSCTTGIDASGLTATSGVAAWNNNLIGCTTPINFPTGTDTGFEAGNNLGIKGKLMGGTVFFPIAPFVSAGGTEAAWAYTIPGGTLSKTGDGFKVEAVSVRAAGADTTTLAIAVGGTTIARLQTTVQNSEHAVYATVFLTDAPDVANNTDSFGRGLSSPTEQIELERNLFLTIDWTVDQTITIWSITSLAGVLGVSSGYVTFYEGEAGGA